MGIQNNSQPVVGTGCIFTMSAPTVASERQGALQFGKGSVVVLGLAMGDSCSRDDDGMIGRGVESFVRRMELAEVVVGMDC